MNDSNSPKDLFGIFLVKQGVVTEEQLLDALTAQLRATPSIGEIVWTGRLLNASQCLHAFERQARTGMDFVAACRELGFWSDELARRVNAAIETKREPLLSILSRELGLKGETLNRALEAYLSGGASESEAIGPVADPREFLAQFNEDARSRLEQGLATWLQTGEKGPFCEELHRMLGVARLTDAKKASEWFLKMEGRVHGLEGKPGEQLVSELQRDVSTVWELRTRIAGKAAA